MRLDQMFSDGRFTRYGLHRYFAETGGRKVGIVLATMNSGYDSYALNKSEFDRLVSAKRDGRLDDAFVVAAKTAGSKVPSFCDQIDAEELVGKLAGELPRSGRYGDFFILPPGLGFPARPEDEPF